MGNPCDVCQNRTCTMKELGGKINGEIKKVITKSGDRLKATVDTVECKAVGDVYNTIVISICADGLKGFTDFSWSFVYCAFFGVVLIGMTILLNMCVGLRPL